MPMLTVSTKGWVVIPVEFRRKYELEPGARVMLVDYGGVLALVPTLERPVDQANGLLEGKPSLARALRVERARDQASEG